MAEDSLREGGTAKERAKETEHFSLRDLESFIETAELVEAAARGLISLKELEERLAARVAVAAGRKSQASA